jgi:hypothetical protein
LASTLGAPAARGDWFETEPGRQRKSAATLMPTPIMMAKEATAGKTRILKVRCYADNDYRIGVIRWQDRVRAQLEAMNRVIEPALGRKCVGARRHRGFGGCHAHRARQSLTGELGSEKPDGRVVVASRLRRSIQPANH